MPRPPVLPDDERERALASLPDWSGDAGALVRTVELPSFAHAVAALVRVAAAAEAMDHHPDVDLRWRTLRLVLRTHVPPGVTALDVALAQRVDAVVGEVAALPAAAVSLGPAEPESGPDAEPDTGGAPGDGVRR